MRYRPFFNYFFGGKKDVKSNPEVNYVMTEKEVPKVIIKQETTYHGLPLTDSEKEFVFSGPTFEHLDPILAEVQRIEKRQFALLEKKHKMYGSKNLAQGKTDMQDPENIKQSMRGIVIRMQDKLSRLATVVELIGQANPAELDESITDTLDDISNYGKLGAVIASGKWVTGEK